MGTGHDRKIEIDPSKNNFPVTLHDPCNMVRQMGIVKPQREILKVIAPQFREMTLTVWTITVAEAAVALPLWAAQTLERFADKVSARMKFNRDIGFPESIETLPYLSMFVRLFQLVSIRNF